MTQAELLRYLVEILETVGAEYMIGGSQAAMYYGEPRLTRDVDVIVALPLDQLTTLLRRFPPDEFYVDEDAARLATATSGQFNIIHPGSGLKIDVYVSPDAEYVALAWPDGNGYRSLPASTPISLAPRTSSFTSCSTIVSSSPACTCATSSESSACLDRSSTNPTSRSGPRGSDLTALWAQVRKQAE
jgi:hypothetical protein